MSERYGASYQARPVIEGLPRTNIATPGFQLSAGLFLFGFGLLMFWTRTPAGEWSANMIRGYRAGAWLGAIAGGALLLCAARGLTRARARIRARAERSPDAWTLDYDWTPGVCRDHAVAAAFEAAFWIAVSMAICAVAMIFLSDASQAALLGSRVASLLLIGLCCLCIRLSAGTVRRGLLFGESVLRWDGGGPLRAGTEWTGAVAVAESVAAPYCELHFVAEKKIVLSRSVSYERHESNRLDAAARVERDAEGRKIVRLSVRIPADVPSTDLSRDPARYWEMHVADDASGWATTFLVPVYP